MNRTRLLWASCFVIGLFFNLLPACDDDALDCHCPPHPERPSVVGRLDVYSARAEGTGVPSLAPGVEAGYFEVDERGLRIHYSHAGVRHTVTYSAFPR
jgi:hypothetical protein